MARLSKAQREEAKRLATLAEAERLAGLLSASPTDSSELLAPPSFIADPRLAPALIVWKELAPSLQASGRLATLDRQAFAVLCYWQAEFITAADDILARGYSFMVKATTGGKRPWVNPSVARRDTAWAQIMALSERFGLTPLDRAALAKVRRVATGDDDGLPLTQTPAAAPAAAPATKPPGKFDGLLPN